jgi:hypothetical protein
MNEVASAMNNALPAVDALWGKQLPYNRQLFADQFDRLRTLQYA